MDERVCKTTKTRDIYLVEIRISILKIRKNLWKSLR